MMPDQKKIAYIARFIILCWIAIGATIGIVIGLAHLLRNTMVTIIVIQGVIYSGLFGWMGWQQYQRRAKREEGWRGSSDGQETDVAEVEDAEGQWQ